MADPFVQRMMARAQARQKILDRVFGEDEKENVTNHNVKSSVTLNDIPSSPTKVNAYRSTDLDQTSHSPEKKIPTESKEVLKESSSQSLASSKSSLSSVLSNKVSDPPPHTTSRSPSSARVSRFQHLAQRTKQLEQWEDDYTYHSVAAGSAKEVEESGMGLHVLGNASCNNVRQHDQMLMQSPKKDTLNVNTKKQYYFGDGTSASNNIEEKHSLNNSISSQLSRRTQTPLSVTDESYWSALSSDVSPHWKSNMSLNSHSLQSCKTTPSSTPILNCKTKPSSSPFSIPSRSVSPTRRLAWDRQLIDSLEAQGFTPTTSRSKLSYDYRDPSPDKEGFRDRSPIKESSRSRSPSKKNNCDLSNESSYQSSNQGNQETSVTIKPVIVSVHSKSNISNKENTTGDNLSREQLSQNRERSQSPSKVTDLRSHWEQQIRNASPERKAHGSRSPSPTRKGRMQSYTTSTASMTEASVPPASILKKVGSGHMPLSNQVKSSKLSNQPENNVSKAYEGFSRASTSRVSLRSSSPHKSISSAEVIKGEHPMPETTPIVNPEASVKERAAAFSSMSDHKFGKKDPTELSVQDRKSLFEKRKGTALIPKAPFGQCVSDKTLQSSSARETMSSRSYEIPKAVKTACGKSNNATYICSSGSSSKQNASDEVRESTVSSAKNVIEEQRKRFERIEDNWRETDINSKVMNERKTEMEQLLNRFRKPRNDSRPQSLAGGRDIVPEADSDSEYPESEDSSGAGESDVFGSHQPSFAMGPPKPPRTAAFLYSPNKNIPQPPLGPNSPRSPSTRLNSTELNETYPLSPSKEYVPKVKPGCLFPSLSDIDSHSEAVESDDDNKDSSFAESVLTCASGESLGTRIQIMAQGTNKGPPRQLSTIAEGNIHSSASNNQLLSESALEAVGAIDDALEEAFDDDSEPTPPKRGRMKPDDEENKNVYKTPKISHSSSSRSSDSDNNLAHTISMYRKQRPAEIQVTPVRQIIRKPDILSPSKESPVSPSVTISSRIHELQEEEEHQLTVISQASSAISVVSQHHEQHGTMQHIEAEKLLLVATQKRQSALDEIQRLKAEGALGRRNYLTQDEDSCRGSISISKMTLPLRQDFLDRSLNANSVHHFLVLVKHREQVIVSQLQTTPNCIVEGAITFPNLMSLHDLSADFNISLEVYGLKVDPIHSGGFKKDHSRMRLIPLKRLHKEPKAAFSPAVSSPGGPYAVRSPSFTLIGFAHLSINTLTRNAWTLEKVPFDSPMNGHLLMSVAVSMEGGVSERSFLTLFDDVGGFGAWNRRWCALSGPFIRYWSYPDDENKKECVGCLDLRMCTTRTVEQVPRDICARPFTFQLTLLRPLKPDDKSDLIHQVKDNTLVTRMLISADSKEERIVWCNKLNKALANIRAWDPDALKPEDYHV